MRWGDCTAVKLHSKLSMHLAQIPESRTDYRHSLNSPSRPEFLPTFSLRHSKSVLETPICCRYSLEHRTFSSISVTPLKPLEESK